MNYPSICKERTFDVLVKQGLEQEPVHRTGASISSEFIDRMHVLIVNMGVILGRFMRQSRKSNLTLKLSFLKSEPI